MDQRMPLIAKELAPHELDLAPVRTLLTASEEDRDLDWLKRMLQFAVELEFKTIPPYLVAMWSIKDPGSIVVTLLSGIVKQEMLHMGMVCNLLNTIGGTPKINDPHLVPHYPGPLPGGVNPKLKIGLERISLDLVANTFMAIEEPEFAPIVWFKGQTFPTIGAFYTAIEKRVAKLDPHEITGERQLSLNKPDFPLKAIKTVSDAVAAIDLIKAQGEGTSSSPLYGPNPTDISHYFLFGEIYNGKQIKKVDANKWTYSGDPVPFPDPKDIYPMAPIPSQGYPESREFNAVYATMLNELQTAWELGEAKGGIHLTKAMIQMTKLGSLATDLMQKETVPGSGVTLGPTFQIT